MKRTEYKFKHQGKKYVVECYTIGKGKRVFLTGGVHGNEPAGVLALQEFMKDIKKYLDKFEFTIIPCVNPVGRKLNVRNNGDDVNLNRQFAAKNPPAEVKFIKRIVKGRYAFSFDLHEDPTDEVAENAPEDIPPEELYLYEVSQNSKGRKILDVLEKKYPICKRKEIYHEKCENGLVWASGPSEEIPGTLYEYMSQFTTNAFTLETPTCWPLKKRVQAHLAALNATLEIFK